jgi:hypothetical protein
MDFRARPVLLALRPQRLAGVLALPAVGGIAAGIGIAATADTALLDDIGGAGAVLLACLTFFYLCLAAAQFAMGLAAMTNDLLDLDGDDGPTAEAEAYWAIFPNGFDFAALASGIAWVLIRLGG